MIWNLPSGCFGINGLTVIQQRVIASMAVSYATLIALGKLGLL